MRLEDKGVIQKWEQIYWPHPSPCDMGDTMARQLDLADVQGVFFCLLGMLTLCFIILLIEVSRNIYQQEWHNEQRYGGPGTANNIPILDLAEKESHTPNSLQELEVLQMAAV